MAAPANDNFASAELISPFGTSGTVNGDLTDATFETGEPNSIGSSSVSVWYTFTTSVKRLFNFGIGPYGSFGPPRLNIYTGSFLTALTYRGGSPGTGSAWIVLHPGLTYYIQVVDSGAPFGGGAFTFTWSVPNDPPANDDFANAEEIPSFPNSGSQSGTTLGATWELGEPFSFGPDTSIWYKFTTPSDRRRYYFTGANPGTVWTGSSVGALTLADTYPSSPALEASTEYFIRVPGFTLGGESVSFSWVSYTSPANDDFDDAILLTGTSGTETVPDTRGARREPGDPEIHADQACTVWWKYVAPSDGLLDINLIAATLDDTFNYYPYLYILRGTDIDSLELLAVAQDSINDPDLTTDVPFYPIAAAVNEGDTVYFEYANDGAQNDQGTFDVSFDWRFISTRVWEHRSTFPNPIYSGDNQLGKAMESFGGSVWPTAPDANGGIWTIPDWTPAGTVSLEANDLLMDSGSGDVGITYMEPDGDELFLTCATDLEFEIGFEATGFIPDNDFNQYTFFSWRPGSSYLGWVMQSEGPTNTYPQFSADLKGSSWFFQMPQDWPIRTRWNYDASDQKWSMRYSFDGGATWKFGGIGGTTPTTTLYRFGESDLFSEIDLQYRFEGWGTAPPPPPPFVPGASLADVYFRAHVPPT